MDSSVVAPSSAVKRSEYEQKLAAALKKQQEAFESRVVSNAQYAKTATEKILREHKARVADEQKKLAAADSFYVPAESNFLVVMQIKSQKRIGPTPKKILELMRIKTINSAVIAKNNKSIQNMLQKAKDYVAYGTISYELLRKLVYTRGFGRIGHSKVKLTNENIETVFEGKYKCIEELINAIYSGSEDMKQVCSFLCPFRLSAPLGGFKGKKSMSYLQGGAAGNHKELLCNLLERMI